MTIGELRQQLGKLTIDQQAPVEIAGEVYSQIEDEMGSRPAHVSVRDARISVVEQVGGRVVLTIDN